MKNSMKIQQYKPFQFKSHRYGFIKTTYYQNPISHVELFLHDAYGYVSRAGGPIPFLDSLHAPNGECGTTIEMVDLNVDIKNDLIYLGEVFDPYEHGMSEQEFNIKYNNMNALQLCQNNIVDCAVMTKENFIHLLNAWKEIWQNQSPFALLYLDDKNWYDILPFDSQQAMEEFIAAHTQQENKN